MNIKLTILDMGNPVRPTTVMTFVIDTEVSLQYPLMTTFPLPATTDARVQHPYAVVVEEVE